MSETTYKLVPVEPTEEMWDSLARDIVMWCRFDRPSERALLQHLKSLGRTIPDWLTAECRDVDHVPPKGSVAVWIYRAMLDAAPRSPAMSEPSNERSLSIALAEARKVIEDVESHCNFNQYTRAYNILIDWLTRNKES